MATVETVEQPVAVVANRDTAIARTGPPRDLQRTFQLVLATIWLLDAVLQIQPFMFTRGIQWFQRDAERIGRREPQLGGPHHHLERIDRLPPTDPDQHALCPHPVPDRLRHRLEENDANPLWRSPSCGPSGCGGSAKGRVGSSTERHSVRRRPRRRALLCGPCRPAVAERRIEQAVRGCPHRRPEGGPDHLGGGVGPPGAALGGGIRTFAPGTARPGGRGEQRTTGVARSHRSRARSPSSSTTAPRRRSCWPSSV